MSRRPQLHFTPERGWLNDPHGITWWGGRYHLFHQNVPDQTTWGPHCHWAHVSSPDLVGDWVDEGIALAPGEGDDGVWTGSLVLDPAGEAHILYTSIETSTMNMGVIRFARPLDSSWRQWTKGDIVIRPPEGLGLTSFRDPFVQREGEGWVMHVGAGSDTGVAMALRYRSDDLTSWRFEGSTLGRSTHERDPVWMGSLWECPQVIDIDGYTVMVSSIFDEGELHYAGAAVGTMVDGRLAVETWQRISHGDSYYAPSFFRDSESRPCLMFWMRGFGGEEAGWASALSVPHLLSVKNRRLHLEPHPHLTERLAAMGDGSTADIHYMSVPRWAPDQGTLFERRDSAGAPIAVVRATDAELVLDRPDTQSQSIPYRGGEITLLVDGDVLEIWTGGEILGASLESD